MSKTNPLDKLDGNTREMDLEKGGVNEVVEKVEKRSIPLTGYVTEAEKEAFIDLLGRRESLSNGVYRLIKYALKKGEIPKE